jgi:D-methionine transport system substrate-binding protein
MNKRYVFSFVLSIGLIVLGAWHQMKSEPAAIDLRVGTVSGPETELMQLAKKIAKEKYNLNIQIIEFNDYHFLNRALHEGSLDANVFQHEPYLQEEKKHAHYELAILGKTFIYPMGLYSKKWKNLKTLPEGAVIAIPNDPTNEGRALLLLEKSGLIQLNATDGFLATPQSICHNPKNLKFKEIEAAQLIRALSDVDLAAINTNYAVLADLYPTRSALFAEDKNSAYANLIVVREKDRNNKKLNQLVEVFRDEQILILAKQLFKSQAIPAYH